MATAGFLSPRMREREKAKAKREKTGRLGAVEEVGYYKYFSFKPMLPPSSK